MVVRGDEGGSLGSSLTLANLRRRNARRSNLADPSLDAIES